MKKSFKPGAMISPLPAVMVSCGEDEEKNIITIAWTGIINSTPPLTYVSVRKSRHSHELIQKNREFVINLVNEELTFAADYCGVKSGRDIDKFAEMNLTPEPSEVVSCPGIGESPLNLECRVIEIHEYPSHDMFVAEIVNVKADKNIVDEKGKINLAEAGLMAYVHGEYMGIKKNPLGRFGYSVMKAKTKKRIGREKHAERVEKNRKKRETKSQGKTSNLQEAVKKNSAGRKQRTEKTASKRSSGYRAEFKSSKKGKRDR